MKILILCTGNSCRSQMAEGFLRSFDPKLEVFSAGTNPANQVQPNTIKVMNEVGIDISSHFPKNVDRFLNDEFDYVITVCDSARETCPVFTGKVKERFHIGFDDPYDAVGTEEEKLNEYRRVRDEIKRDFLIFYNENIMNINNELKETVRKKYAEIALQDVDYSSTCCGTGSSCCSPNSAETFDYTVMSDDYTQIEGYVPDADLGLGCGLPTEFAGIEEGNTVLDLGSGAGNDVFIARRIVGESGKVLGIDFTDEMLDKASLNCDKLGYKNVEFVKGDIEEMPIEDNTVDVVISNCVLNLVPDKQKAFSEMHRVIKPGGHFCVSDIVIEGDLPEKLLNAAAMYTGCVSGALQKSEYLRIIREKGFEEPQIKKEKEIHIPNHIMLDYIDLDELRQFKTTRTKILSVTVVAKK